MSIYTLAIETSCDETSAAVLQDGRTVVSNVISSQVPIHRKFGGVVPEVASRHHIEQIMPVIDQALADANLTLDDMDHIGVTYGPGLVGALLVGVSAAKALSFAKDIFIVSLSIEIVFMHSIILSLLSLSLFLTSFGITRS